MSKETTASESKPSQTYEAGCHCGYIKFSVTLSPPLPETMPLECDCSACRRFGYLLVYPTKDKVQWHAESWDRLSKYRFNTKNKDQLFCGRCGASIGIDFRECYAPRQQFGISVRTFNGIDLNALEFEPSHGVEEVEPAGDLSGIWYDLEEKERAEQIKKEQDEKELAAAAVTA